MNYIMGDYEDYKDEVIYDLLFFVKEKINSDEDIATWYTDIDNDEDSKLDSLFDKDQSIFFYNKYGNLSIRKLENNKLLTITSTKDIYRTYYVMDLYSDADKFKINVDIDNGSVDLMNNKKQVYSYLLTSKESLENLPDNLKISDLKPVSLEQLFERGKKQDIVDKNQQKTLRKTL